VAGSVVPVVVPDGEHVRATHRVELLGLRLFTLRYDISRRADAER